MHAHKHNCYKCIPKKTQRVYPEKDFKINLETILTCTRLSHNNEKTGIAPCPWNPTTSAPRPTAYIPPTVYPAIMLTVRSSQHRRLLWIHAEACYALTQVSYLQVNFRIHNVSF